MATTRLSAISAAPPEIVYDLFTNLDRMKEWVGGVTKVTDVDGALGRTGTSYIVWFGPVKSPTVVLEAERPLRYRSRFGSWVLRGESDTAFEPEGEGTRIRQEIRTIGWFSEISSRVFSIGSYKGSYQGELNEFARLAEVEAAKAR
ncbi:MAG TPA: SRPBCC family protein [Candidatus Limnocylindria bacterium]|nr:SRPBCC family protein [Candidatus Limnocylindria bacterium]